MAATTASQPGHDLLDTTAIQLIGVATFTILAGINDDMGSTMVIVMWGFALGWFLLHTTQLSNMVKVLLWRIYGRWLPCFSWVLSLWQ